MGRGAAVVVVVDDVVVGLGAEATVVVGGVEVAVVVGAGDVVGAACVVVVGAESAQAPRAMATANVTIASRVRVVCPIRCNIAPNHKQPNGVALCVHLRHHRGARYRERRLALEGGETMGVVPQAVQRGDWSLHRFYCEVVGYELALAYQSFGSLRAHHNRRLFLHCVAPGGVNLADERFVVQIEFVDAGIWEDSQAPIVHLSSMNHSLLVDSEAEFDRIYELVRGEKPVYFSSQMLSIAINVYLDWSQFVHPWQTSDRTKQAMVAAFQAARSDRDDLIRDYESAYRALPGDWMVFTGSEAIGEGEADADDFNLLEDLDRRLDAARRDLAAAERRVAANPRDLVAQLTARFYRTQVERLEEARANLA